MDTKTFLTRVLSPTDEVVICTHKPDSSGANPRGFFWDRGSFADIDAAVAQIHKLDVQQDLTVYYSVGKFADHEYQKSGVTRHHRTKDKATSFKALALDLDIGVPKTPYATQRDGWMAMSAALAQISFPKPMVVSSGNGIHCYWPLTAAVTTAQWEETSMALRFALEEAGVVIDVSKIHDASMVLRPVGSHHKKQTPWKEVKCVADCPDHDYAALHGLLSKWVGKVPAHKGSKPSHARSATMAAVLDGPGDIVYEAVAQSCAQIGSLVASGGATDAAGRPTTYPTWILGLQFARKCVDPEAAVIALGSQYPNFDLQESLDKMNSFTGGVPFCATFESACAAGCSGCPRKGTITNPGQLNRTIDIAPPPGVEAITLPKDYFIDSGRVWTEEEKEVTQTLADGKKDKSTVLQRVLVCPYEMHIMGMFTDKSYSSTTAILYVKYPLGNWKEHDLPLGILSTSGKEFSDYMINKQVFIAEQTVVDRTRRYLMRYLDMVQKQNPTGEDFVAFGWQEDGAFLCGEALIGSPTGNESRRLKGAAARYGDIVKKHGDREVWADATAMLDAPEANNIASAILFSGIGVFGKVAGNACGVVSYFSTETTTGKTLCLHAANSTFGNPRELLMRSKDTSNATYKMRGTLNNLPGTLDELTLLPAEAAVDMAYSFSEGREKIAMTRDRELREPATWQGPTLVTCNISMLGKYAEVMAHNDPVRARTLEFVQDDNTFARLTPRGGRDFFDAVHDNYGFLIPELVELVIQRGGPRKVWDDGVAAFDNKFGFEFEPQERFSRTDVIGAWIVGMLGRKLGLIRFDVNRVVEHVLARITECRQEAIAGAMDCFDILGQFLQEHNDQLIFTNEEYAPNGKGKEVVQYPIPHKAVARLSVVRDDQNPILPGSRIAINTIAIKRWMSRSKDSVDRLLTELRMSGALIAAHQRVTLYKGCQGQSPAQAFCVVVNLNHPRFVQAFTAPKSYQPSPVALAVLQGGAP